MKVVIEGTAGFSEGKQTMGEDSQAERQNRILASQAIPIRVAHPDPAQKADHQLATLATHREP